MGQGKVRGERPALGSGQARGEAASEAGGAAPAAAVWTRWGPKLVRAERGRRGEEGVWAMNTLSVMDVGGGSGPRQSVCRVVGG